VPLPLHWSLNLLLTQTWEKTSHAKELRNFCFGSKLGLFNMSQSQQQLLIIVGLLFSLGVLEAHLKQPVFSHFQAESF
jgi:hypothetical protein